MTDIIGTEPTPDQRYHKRILLAAGRAYEEAYDSPATRQLIVELTGLEADSNPWTDARDTVEDGGPCNCFSCVGDVLDLHKPIDGVSPELTAQTASLFTAVVNREPAWCNPLVEDWWKILQLPGSPPLLARRLVSITTREPGTDTTCTFTWDPRVRPDALNDDSLLLMQVRHRYQDIIGDGREVVAVQLLPDNIDVPF